MAMDPETADITLLLREWRGGNAQALDQLVPLVYGQLRRLANQILSGEKAGHTLSATEVVHEAWFRLRNADMEIQDRAHFVAIAARQMRHVLVEHARAKQRDKRGGELQRVTLSGIDTQAQYSLDGLLTMDRAFQKLVELDDRKAQVAELFLFGGLTAEEVSTALAISTATVNRDWAFARGFLRNEMGA